MKSALEERKDVWRRAQAARRRLCIASEAKTVQEMMSAVSRAKGSFRIRFKLNEAHKITILAMECVWDSRKKPGSHTI